MMRYLIMLEQTEAGFSVQVPDLAVVTCGDTIETAKHAAIEAIQSNLEAYRETGQAIPERRSVEDHLENPEFQELVFAYVEVPEPKERIAA
jgi:predicted RNase H-like HicB family nuclease